VAHLTYEQPKTTARGNERYYVRRAAHTILSPTFHHTNANANACEARRARRKDVPYMKLIAFIITIVLTVGIAGEYGIPFDVSIIYYLILSVCFFVAFAQQQQARRR